LVLAAILSDFFFIVNGNLLFKLMIFRNLCDEKEKLFINVALRENRFSLLLGIL